jgi:cytochrome c oxidase cbb3-type subunit 3
MTRSKHISYIVGTLALVASSACVDDSSAAQAGGRQARTQRQPQQPAADSVRFVDHPEHIQLGRTTPNPSALRLTNPLAADPQVKTVGAQLYRSYNCVDCHGMDGSGAMGPSLADGRWRFGGTPSEVFESIYQGRPDGMPAWGGRISDADIWRLVAYVRSLEIGKNVATENFTGKAQQRMGH